MIKMLGLDPGESTGWAKGWYDAITPFTLTDRGEVLGGEEGFKHFLLNGGAYDVDIIVCEKFVLLKHEFVANTSPLVLEGILIGMHAHPESVVASVPLVWQTALDKASLINYPDSADTADKRQRLRFQWLERFGLFKAGTAHDDSNDAITHLLVYLKNADHRPTMMKHWGPRSRRLALVPPL